MVATRVGQPAMSVIDRFEAQVFVGNNFDRFQCETNVLLMSKT